MDVPVIEELRTQWRRTEFGSRVVVVIHMDQLTLAEVGVGTGTQRGGRRYERSGSTRDVRPAALAWPRWVFDENDMEQRELELDLEAPAA